MYVRTVCRHILVTHVRTAPGEHSMLTHGLHTYVTTHVEHRMDNVQMWTLFQHDMQK